MQTCQPNRRLYVLSSVERPINGLNHKGFIPRVGLDKLIEHGVFIQLMGITKAEEGQPRASGAPTLMRGGAAEFALCWL